jgi:hypothetical protein
MHGHSCAVQLELHGMQAPVLRLSQGSRFLWLLTAVLLFAGPASELGLLNMLLKQTTLRYWDQESFVVELAKMEGAQVRVAHQCEALTTVFACRACAQPRYAWGPEALREACPLHGPKTT